MDTAQIEFLQNEVLSLKNTVQQLQSQAKYESHSKSADVLFEEFEAKWKRLADSREQILEKRINQLHTLLLDLQTNQGGLKQNINAGDRRTMEAVCEAVASTITQSKDEINAKIKGTLSRVHDEVAGSKAAASVSVQSSADFLLHAASHLARGA